MTTPDPVQTIIDAAAVAGLILFRASELTKDQ